MAFDLNRALIGSTVDPALLKQAKLYCRDRGITMNEFLDKAFGKMLYGYIPAEEWDDSTGKGGSRA